MDNSVLDRSPEGKSQSGLQSELAALELIPMLQRLMDRVGWTPIQTAIAAGIDERAFRRLLRGAHRQFKRENVELLIDALEFPARLIDADELTVWRDALYRAATEHFAKYIFIQRRLKSTQDPAGRAQEEQDLLMMVREALERFREKYGYSPAWVPAIDMLLERWAERFGWIRVPKGFELDELGDDEYTLTRGLIIDPADFGPDVDVTHPEPGRYIIRRKGAPPRLPAEPKPAERPPESPPDRLPERRTPGLIEPELIRIPSGEFWMGSADGDKDAGQDEKPRHLVKLDDFWIARYLVTNEEYQYFLDDNATHAAPAHFTLRRYPADKRRHPVVNVSWHDALAYCRWLKRRTGADYTLPSEAEWEKAARGTDGRIYPWGNTWDASRCNSSEDKAGGTTPVGQYSARGGDSPYHVADMAGNVWEWTRSLWWRVRDEGEYRYPYDPEDRDRENLQAPDTISRVVRGGSFYFDRRLLRCAYRDYRSPPLPDYRSGYIGFRVVVWSPGSR